MHMAVATCFLRVLLFASWHFTPPPITFNEVTGSAGILPSFPEVGMTSGLAAADFDDDGYVDLFVPNGAGMPDQLYRNLGSLGQFEEIGAGAGVASLLEARGALWFDYDGDRDLDLLVTRDDPPPIFSLYRQNSPGAFQDVTLLTGLIVPISPRANPPPFAQQRSGACAGDINGDGFLDFCVTIWNGKTRLFLNNKDGSFTEITDSSGLGAVLAHFWQPVMYDFNKDGWLDIYVLVDFEPNLLWLNQGNNTFVEAGAGTGIDNHMNDMGVTLGDYDNDGDMDLYITCINFTQDTHNVLLRNDSTPGVISYTEVSFVSQVQNGGWGWGTTFFDGDRDGWVDIAATNGWGGFLDPSKFFRNPGTDPFVFEDLSDAVGFNDTDYGSSLVAFDYDRDGDLDLAQSRMDGPLRLLACEPTGAELRMAFGIPGAMQ